MWCESDDDVTHHRVSSLFAIRKKPSQLLQKLQSFIGHFLSQDFKANPGLELANAFSVGGCRPTRC
jgi:hypothetical protein